MQSCCFKTNSVTCWQLQLQCLKTKNNVSLVCGCIIKIILNQYDRFRWLVSEKKVSLYRFLSYLVDKGNQAQLPEQLELMFSPPALLCLVGPQAFTHPQAICMKILNIILTSCSYTLQLLRAPLQPLQCDMQRETTREQRVYQHFVALISFIIYMIC